MPVDFTLPIYVYDPRMVSSDEIAHFCNAKPGDMVSIRHSEYIQPWRRSLPRRTPWRSFVPTRVRHLRNLGPRT